MATKIVLTVGSGLTEQEQTDLRYLLTDALGEFAASRSPANEYVKSRYPDDQRFFAYDDKVAQVERRNTLARKLHNAALHFEVVPCPSNCRMGHLYSDSSADADGPAIGPCPVCNS